MNIINHKTMNDPTTILEEKNNIDYTVGLLIHLS